MKILNLEERIMEVIPKENIHHISNEEMRCYCPLHDDSRYSFSINLRTGNFICNGCGKSGNLNTLITEIQMQEFSLIPTTAENVEAITMFDTHEHTEKPRNIGAIKNRITEELSVRKYSIQEIQANILKGKTMIPAGIKSDAKNNFVSQQIFCMDFDNSEIIDNNKIDYFVGNPKHISIEQIKVFCKENNIEPTFIYTTFRHSEQQHKYRLVYVFEEPINDFNIANLIVLKLFHIFKDFRPDPMPKNLASMFFGGREIVFDSKIFYKCEYIKDRQRQLTNIASIGMFFNDKKFCFDRFANNLLAEYSIIKIDNRLHIYQDGIYVDNLELIERKMFDFLPLSDSQRKEVIKYLKLFAEEKKESPAKYIAVGNGVINLQSGELLPFEKGKYIFKNKIPWNYKKPEEITTNEYCIVDNFFDRISCKNEEIKQLLYEIIGYCLYRSCIFKTVFIIIGNGFNGKSPYFKLINSLLGLKNVTNISLSDLTTRPFRLAELYGKLANISDDETQSNIANTGLIKRLSAGGRESVEKKGQDPFEFQNYAKLLISFNDNVKFADTSFGFNERLLIVPFNAKILKTDNDYKVNFEELLFTKENLEYILYKSIQAFKQVLGSMHFTISQEVKESIKQYLYDNNYVLQFLDSHPITVPQKADAVYSNYKSWCIKNSIKILALNEFGKELKKLGYDKKRIQKGNVREFYYEKKT